MNQLSILNRNYLTVVQKHCINLIGAAQFCAAKLIHYFCNWTSWKKAVQRTDWIYQKLTAIRADLFGEHSLHQIRAAIASLVEAGILERRNNPGNGQDRTYQYRVNTEKLNEVILNAADSSSEVEDSDLNVQNSTVESQPYNQSIESIKKIVPNNTGGGEENVSLEKPTSDLIGEPKRFPVLAAKNPTSDNDKSSRACSTTEIFCKYEDRLKLYGVYLQAWQGSELVPNPKLFRAIAAARRLKSEQLERSIQAFLIWAQDAKNVRDIYAALTAAIARHWQS